MGRIERIETLDRLTDDEATEQLRAGVRDVKEGRTVSWEEARERLGV